MCKSYTAAKPKTVSVQSPLEMIYASDIIWKAWQMGHLLVAERYCNGLNGFLKVLFVGFIADFIMKALNQTNMLEIVEQ